MKKDTAMCTICGDEAPAPTLFNAGWTICDGCGAEQIYKKVLDKAGYDLPPTAESVKECFMDYVDSGVFGMEATLLDWNEEIATGRITIERICRGLFNYKG